MMWQGNGWSSGHWLLTGSLMLLVWALVIAGAIWAWRFLASRPRAVSAVQPSAAVARRLLDERFARGEIDAAEYQSRREMLGAS